MAFCHADLLFKMPLVFTIEKHGDVHMYAVSAVEMEELLMWNTSSDTNVIKFHTETHLIMYTEF
jgi:hypothetical protein